MRDRQSIAITIIFLVDLDGCQISQTNTVEYLQYRQVTFKKTKQQIIIDDLIFDLFSSPNLWA